ncbi:hypothetical protein TNCV_456011 [Trichonephila clavipes]|nr:hypothetical protein TNCV_456011 [Trichonephila clavipes]
MIWRTIMVKNKVSLSGFPIVKKKLKVGDGKLRALDTEEAFNGLFDFIITSKMPSGKIFLQSQKEMKVTWYEIRTGGWCRHSQPRVAICF